MNPSSILISNLSFSYQENLILERVNLEVGCGEFIGIMGPNGGGKTTFLKLLMGFLVPQKGTISLFGKPPQQQRLRIGYVPQAHHTDRDFPITVSELVLLGALSPRLFYSSSVKQRAQCLMDELGLLPYQHHLFSSLSGGLAQRALLARALLSDPDLLLLDELLANIDSSSSQAIMERLEHLKGKKTLLMVTHDLRTIVERVDRILCIQTSVSSLLPKEVCEHFALGLYHTPLIQIPVNHFKRGSHVDQCAHQ